MQQYAITIEPELISSVDEYIKKSGLYSSRNEFIRESIRERLIEIRKAQMTPALEAWREKMRSRGEIKMPTKDERDKIVTEYLKEKGII